MSTTEADMFPFANTPAAQHALTRLLDGAPAGFAASLKAALDRVPLPERALPRFVELLDATAEPQAERARIAESAGYAEMLAAAFVQSQFLSNIILRSPEYLAWLWREGSIHVMPNRDALMAEAAQAIACNPDTESQRKALRLFKQRHTLRIGLRDVFMHASMASVTEDLANAADACIEGALRCAVLALEPRHGKPMLNPGGHPEGAESTFVVLAMGKLGGRELNFSSDIDLIYIYGGEGDTAGGRTPPISNAEYFHRLGEHMIKTLTDVTQDGWICRVDMRLRPHGRMGPLSVGFDNAVDYYERYSQAWERQALVKARPCAGDIELGNRFLEQTRRFVYPKHYDDEKLEEIREMKRQMEAIIEVKGQTESEVKLGRGGIRDIEFTVQMLQMLHGGRYPALQVQNTLKAIQALEMHDLLRHFEAGTLVGNYIFLRNVEHRLQIENNRQVHALPASSEDLEDFAIRLGYESAESFMTDYRFRAESTREILERFLQLKGSGTLWISDLLNPMSEGEASLPKLAEMGFHDPRRARDEVLLLSSGPSQRPHTSHVRQQFARIAPALLQALAGVTGPDATLSRLVEILGNLRAPSAIYDILRWNPVLCEYLALLVANSRMLAEMLTRDPGLFETFGYSGALDAPTTSESLEAQFDQLRRAYDSEAAIYRLRDGEMLRIGLRDLLLAPSIFQIGEELTHVAGLCLRHVYEHAQTAVRERFGDAERGLAVLGLGKLGGLEMGYGSDLDLVFVYDGDAGVPPGTMPVEYYSAMAAQMIKRLKEPTRYGILYDIDARLRPDGRRGVLAVSLARMEQYYREEAESWERLALLKARHVAGDATLGDRAEMLARSLAFGEHLTLDGLERIETVRKRIVANTNRLDLKKDEGGIAEIEFTLRLLQISHVREVPGLARGDVQGALLAIRSAGLLDVDRARTLEESYVAFRRIENRIRMMEGRPGSALPDNEAERVDLARRLGYAGDLLDTVNGHKHAVHGVYVHVLERIRQQVAHTA